MATYFPPLISGSIIDEYTHIYLDIIEGAASTREVSGVLYQEGVQKTVDFYPNQSAVTIWDPTSGYTWVMTDYDLSFQADGIITVFDNTNDNSGRLFKFYGAANGGAVHAYRKPKYGAAPDNIMKYTTDSTCSGTLTVWGYEI